MGCIPAKNALKQASGPASSSPPAFKRSFSKKDTIHITQDKFFDHYILEENIGVGTNFFQINKYQGSFGEVWKCKSVHDQSVRAVKIIKKPKEHAGKNIMVESEIDVMKTLDSPNVVKIYEVYENEVKIYIVVELLKGLTLTQYIAKGDTSRLSEKVISQMLKQLLIGLNHCHSFNVIHRDIKPDNLMFKEPECTTLKLIDFGFAKLLDTYTVAREAVGSPIYMAPEVVEGKEYDTKCDIWSCGILCYFLLSGRYPYTIVKGENRKSLFEKIKVFVMNPSMMSGEQWEGVTNEAKEFVTKILVKNPAQRLTAKELLQDKWFTSNTLDIIPNPEDKKKALNNITISTLQDRFQNAVLTYIAYHCNIEEERTRLNTIFTALDKNMDHKISREELKAGINGLDINMTPAELEEIFNNADKDNSGSIDYTEFIAAAMNLTAALNEKSMRAAFEYFDKDKSGYIDKEEILNSMRVGWISEQEIEILLTEVDVNKDNKISYDEFKKMLEQLAIRQK